MTFTLSPAVLTFLAGLFVPLGVILAFFEGDGDPISSTFSPSSTPSMLTSLSLSPTSLSLLSKAIFENCFLVNDLKAHKEYTEYYVIFIVKVYNDLTDFSYLSGYKFPTSLCIKYFLIVLLSPHSMLVMKVFSGSRCFLRSSSAVMLDSFFVFFSFLQCLS